MWKKTLIIMGLTILMVAPVDAQSISVGPQVGYYKTKDADDGNFMGGVAWRMKLMPAFGVEASINYRQENYANDALTVRSWPVMVTGLFYPVPVAYGAVGAGWYNTTVDYDQDMVASLEDETTQEFGWHFGGGLELPVGVTSKFTADIRYVFLNYDFGEIPGSGNLESNFYVLTVGFLFGL
ncbi:outer membrane beta-barrel protein [candidate division KSB1 bacterium]|nr:outer membrane beta-barrel protein [candidate division KSB1 bacterium]